jgi:hypothetical protein
MSEIPTTSAEKIKEKDWFLDLLEDVSLSTTKHVMEKIPNVKFSLVNQIISDTHVLRKIVFYDDDNMICEATNRVERNDLVNDWIENHANEPFGTFFQNKETHRELISKTENGRTYKIDGEIKAVIEEKFYPTS